MLIGRFYPVEGGAEIQCRRLSNELRSRNYDVFVLTQALPGVPPFETIDDLPVYRVGLPLNGKLGSFSYLVHGLFWLLKNRSTFDILHAHLASSPAILAAIAGRLCSTPVLVKMAGSRLTGDIRTSSATWYGRLKLRLLNMLTDKFVCPSGEIVQELRAWGVQEERIAALPNGIDTQIFSPAGAAEKIRTRRELSIPESTFVAVYCGRLQRGKGLELLISSWQTISHSREKRSMLLLVVGDGPLEGHLKNDYGLLDTVRFSGWRKDIIRYLHAADLFILPSFGEGMPNALIEAMSCGLPCIATRIGGVMEIVRHGENGLLIEPGDRKALCDYIETMLGNPELALNMGKKAREYVGEHLAIGYIAGRYEILYGQLLKDRASKTKARA